MDTFCIPPETGHPDNELKIVFEQAAYEVNSLASKPNPEWRHTDSGGHQHRWLFNVDGEPYSQQSWREEAHEYYCPDCRDEHTTYDYLCRKCGEALEPGWLAVDDGQSRFESGLTRWRGSVLLAEAPIMDEPLAMADLHPNLCGEAFVTGYESDDLSGKFRVTFVGVRVLAWLGEGGLESMEATSSG